MRNTTKLKQILLKYDVALSLDEDGLMSLSLVDKDDHRMESFAHASYSTLIGKAHSFFLKQVKKEISIKRE